MSELRPYIVTVRVLQSYHVIVEAESAAQAEAKVRAGETVGWETWTPSDDPKWTSVRARADV